MAMIVRPRSHFSDSPDPTGCQNTRGRVGVVGGNSDDEGFRRNSRRRDSLPSSLGGTPSNCPPIAQSSSCPNGLNTLSSGSSPKFAMTPAEFNLFPSTCNSRRPQNAEIERQEDCLGIGHLTTLRSAAFWELRRSVIENGEGLIRRMRDYEQSRLHQQIRQKAKERKKRARKPSGLRSRHKTRPNFSSVSDEDDVLICSEDTSNILSRRSTLATRTRLLDSMDVDGQEPGADYSQVQHYYDEDMPFASNSSRTEKMEDDSESLLSFPESVSPTPSSSSISLPLPQTLTMTTPSSEKALAELNIALANGSCCITDYSPIWTYQQQFYTDEHDTGHGDLWQ